MNRETAKFIATNCVQLFEIITRGGKGTFVSINDMSINGNNINNFMDNIQLIREYADGAQIEYRLSEASDPWCGIDEPSFVKPFEYRVKPEPREFQIVIDNNGNVRDAGNMNAYFPKYKDGTFKLIKVREVL